MKYERMANIHKILIKLRIHWIICHLLILNKRKFNEITKGWKIFFCDFYIRGTDTIYFTYAMPTPTSTPTPTPEPAPTPESGYSIREKCWGEEYEGNTIYITQKKDGDTTTYRGYLNGAWIDLTYRSFAGNGWARAIFYTPDGDTYYAYDLYRYDVDPPLAYT